MIMPIISGASTCAEVQGNCAPPKVSPTIANVVPAITMVFPLFMKSNIMRHVRECVIEGEDLQPINSLNLRRDRTFWSSYTQEEQNKCKRNTTKW